MAAPTTRPQTGSRFDAEAASWDSNPFVHSMSEQAWKAIPRSVPFFKDNAASRPKVLELGCGTGLLSLQVATRAERLVAVDTSRGMIEMLRSKLTKAEASINDVVVPVCVLLEDSEDPHLPPAKASEPGGPRMKFDLVISHLMLHHIPDLAAILKTMLGCLAEGGMVALTDFEDFGTEARRFHPESKMEGVERHGIRREEMGHLMREAGFEDVRVEVAWTARKKVERHPGEFGEKGEYMEFPFLICLGRRPAGFLN